ncbi:hypothetical protein IT408_03520 [Candidatus Uhrbacteria bacterium]|nr:hypothetical protein [Candidatus Uhrbacteria bacterium]
MEKITQPSFTTSVRSNEKGEWLQGIEKQLTPGMHRVVAIDEQGNQDQALLYVVKQEPKVFTQLISWIPPYVGWLIVCLIAIILLLSGYAIRLGQRVEHKKGENRKKKRQTTHAILVTFALICTAISLSYWTNRQTRGRLLEPVLPKKVVKEQGIQLRGTLKSPFNTEGVTGVDLQAGKTHIRTVQGGIYQFSNVIPSEGIKMTHPELKIALRKSIEGNNMDIIFEPGLYNALFDLMQRESRGQPRPQDGRPIYTPTDLSTQELYIGKTELKNGYQSTSGSQFSQVVGIELVSGKNRKTCYLNQQEKKWEVVECK